MFYKSKQAGNLYFFIALANSSSSEMNLVNNVEIGCECD